MRLIRTLVVAVATAASLAVASPASARIGVVMLHGNGSNGLQFSPMVGIFDEAGIGLQTPDMCWSDRRKYDRPAMDCMTDVDRAISRLKAEGYDQIVVAGHSMGGINTLLYAANHAGLAGVIVFAPTSHPGRNETDPTVAFARELVAKGLGDVRTQFPSSGNPLLTMPRAWLSFFGPESPLDDAALLPRITAPLLWVAGTEDSGQRDAAERFRLVASNPLNRFVMVNADHFATPDVAALDTIAWLKQLQSTLDKAVPTH
jgi:pimeloyl-ACP methyl ester carboxylesterase